MLLDCRGTHEQFKSRALRYLAGCVRAWASAPSRDDCPACQALRDYHLEEERDGDLHPTLPLLRADD